MERLVLHRVPILSKSNPRSKSVFFDRGIHSMTNYNFTNRLQNSLSKIVSTEKRKGKSLFLVMRGYVTVT